MQGATISRILLAVGLQNQTPNSQKPISDGWELNACGTAALTAGRPPAHLIECLFKHKENRPVASFIQNQFEQNFVTTSVDHVFNWARLSSIWPLTFGLGLLRHRNDRRQHLAFRYRPFRRGGLSSQPAAVAT